MARYGQRPENALKRANEFMEIGKPARALDTLQEVFRNKKWSYNWSESVLEPIMFRYLELCVELRKSHIAKEGLFQYRNMFQSVNVGSLENVIRGYLRMAEKRTEDARKQSAQAVIDIDDLDNLATPESILLSAVSGEDAQDRSDRTILTPWVKFLWESYCQCLELLRTNAHVENLYHDIARMAFQFCLKYARKTEFRKLCDKLRKHLEDICKLSVQTGNVSINKPETQQFNLETRLFQLDSAIQMELWQEAYKAIEDIHNLMNMSKKAHVAKTMANYYGKLALVFWKAGHCLFHAAALLKLFQISKELKKNLTPEELQSLACTVLVAVLSIPLPSLHPEFDRFIETDKSPVEKAQRLAVLLGLQQPPTRVSLLKEIVRLNVVSLATPELKDLYNWLEVEFDPLVLCKKVMVVVDTLEKEEGSPLCQYVTALRDVALIRLVRQVAQCYQSIRFARLLELSVFADPFHLERLLVDCVRHNDMQIRIDHANKCIQFGVELSEASRESVPEGPFLQEMPSEQVRGQLIRAAGALGRAAALVGPRRKRADRERARQTAVQHYHENKVREHQRVLQRHKIIEDRKEYIERLNTVREEEEARRQEEIARQAQVVEQQRLEVEREEREKRRQQSEIQLIKDRHLKEKMQQISLTAHGQKVLKKLDEEDIKKIDADTIAQKEAEELMKERRELQARLKSQEKRVDYFERAKRIEEIPLLQKMLEEKRVQDKAFWEQQEEERIKQLKESRELDLATAARLKRMTTHKDEFLKRLTSERRTEHLAKVTQHQELMKTERTMRLLERARERKEERLATWQRDREASITRKAEEARRAKDEEERREREEKEREQTEKENAIKEKLDAARKENLAMLERAAARQYAREEEVERKQAAEREAAAWRRGNERAPDKEPPREVRRAPPANEREPREPEKDTSKEEESSWRRGDAPAPAPVAEKKTEAWRPSARGREEPAKDKEEVKEDRPDRERSDRDRPDNRDRVDRGPDRDRSDRGPDRGSERERVDRGGDRDRVDRGGDRDRIDRGGDRDRSDRDKGDTWRRDRDGPERRDDRDRFSERDRFRRDDRDNRDTRRDDRDGRETRGGRDERPGGGGGSSWRRADDNTASEAPAGQAPERGSVWRSAPRDGPRGGDRDGPRGGDRDGPRGGGRGDRDGPRGGDRDGPRGGDRDGPRGGDRDGPRGGDRDGPRGGDRDGPRGGPRDGPRDSDGPRDKDGPKDSPKDAPRRMPPKEEKPREQADADDWQPVRRR